MDLQLVVYQGRVVAACTPRRVFLAECIDVLERDHPVKRFVAAMCLHAGDVLRGRTSAVYGDEDARVFARAHLIPVRELGARLHWSDAELAEHFNVPLAEIRCALAALDARESRSRNRGMRSRVPTD